MTCSYNDIISQKHKNRNPFCIGIAVFVWRGRRTVSHLSENEGRKLKSKGFMVFFCHEAFS